MSKASKYAEYCKQVIKAPEFKLASASLLSVTSDGDLQFGDHALIPEKALEIAAWLIDTFGEEETTIKVPPDLPCTPFQELIGRTRDGRLARYVGKDRNNKAIWSIGYTHYMYDTSYQRSREYESKEDIVERAGSQPDSCPA